MALKLAFSNATKDPICLVLQTLYFGESLSRKRSRYEIDSNTLSGIVEGADFNTVCMLPFAIAMGLIPLLQLLESAHHAKAEWFNASRAIGSPIATVAPSRGSLQSDC